MKKLPSLQFVEFLFHKLSPLQKREFLAFFRYSIYNLRKKAEGGVPLDKRKVIYYEDELEDEFSVTRLDGKHIDESYVYIHKSAFKRFTHFFWYRIVAAPLAKIYTKVAFGHKIKNQGLLKAYRKRGYFLYGNHTQDIGDALMPNMIDMRVDKYVIVNPDNLSIPLIGHVIASLGALPLPGNLRATKNFNEAIEYRISRGDKIVIYPEAHIWPYYTGIRPFKDASFSYPVKLSAPVFCFTNVYKKRSLTRRPRIVTYIDGPFFPDETLPPRERRRELRNQVYKTMMERAALSDIKIIEYIKKENTND